MTIACGQTGEAIETKSSMVCLHELRSSSGLKELRLTSYTVVTMSCSRQTVYDENGAFESLIIRTTEQHTQKDARLR